MQNYLPSEPNKPADPHPSGTSIPLELWIIGHSTRPIEDFIELLQTHGIQLLADVRITLHSHRNPQFHSDALAKSLAYAGVQYRYMPELSGQRRNRPIFGFASRDALL